MARPRTQPEPDDSGNAPADSDIEAREDQAVAVEEEIDDALDAEEKRERERERVENLKSTPKDSAAPTQRSVKGGDTAYAVERLIAEADEFLGEPPHVVAGALYGIDKEYLTVGEAQKLVSNFMSSESPVTHITPGPAEA